MRKSDLLAFLSTIQAAPRKSLSQNFLIDTGIIAKIVTLADIHPGDAVLEIGPGAGAITEQLLAKGAHVMAIEKDKLFAEHLKRFQTNDQRLQVVCTDFLEFPLDSLPKTSWKVVSNLPYQITAPILGILCENGHRFTSATLVVQKEVEERIIAKPKTKTMSALSIFVQFYTEFVRSFPISSNCFYPKPSVESMALRLNFKHTLPPIDPTFFFPIVRKAFQQRRKMLSSSLKVLHSALGDLLQTLGISSKARPEELSLDDWIKLVGTIKQLHN